MSGLSADDGPFDLRAHLVHIDRQIAETRRFMAEQNKLTAEAAKLNRDRFFAPLAVVCATLTAIAALAPSIIRALGG